ncbi:MAG: glutamate synthase-related protein [Bacillota bacterium]
MSLSRYNTSTTNNTKLRTPRDVAPFSGMCAVCTEGCTGPCEIGQSALRGDELLYPAAKATSQTASEKDYPVDFSHLNINGRGYGAFGTAPDETGYPLVRLETGLGPADNRLKLRAPYVFPAIAKLNWRGYYTGAALAGVAAVIGEDMPTTDPGAVIRSGKVVSLPQLKERHDAFYRYNEGYGALFLQANPDDEELGLLEYALEEVGFEAVELKLGQGAKGIQGMNQLSSLEDALRMQEMGYEVFPDPSDPRVQHAWREGRAAPFYKVGRLPQWEEESFLERVTQLRHRGARYVAVKAGPYRVEDLARTLMLASEAGVDLVTFDGAGGGTGNSPLRMMNEWGYPTVYLEALVRRLCEKMRERGLRIPAVAIAGGIAFEDQVFKALALGAPHISLIGLGRAPMAAAMVGEAAARGLEEKGAALEEVFSGLPELRGRYGDEALRLPPGAIGVYNYVRRVNIGLQQLMALCRKYRLEEIRRDDLIALTTEATRVTGVSHAADLDEEAVGRIFDR